MNCSKDIGSEFDTPLEAFFSRKKNDVRGSLLSTGRDCLMSIFLAIAQLKRKTSLNILVPSYLCDSLLVFPKKQKHDCDINFYFYAVNSDLSIDYADFKVKSQYADAALIINYFGFIDTKFKRICDLCKRKKIFIIEDATHSFLSKYDHYGDFVFCSFRKMFPVPEGALLQYPRDFAPLATVSSLAHVLFVAFRVAIGILRKFNYCRPVWRKFSDVSEEVLINSYPRPAKISLYSRLLLQGMDVDRYRRERIDNFLFLSARMSALKKIKPLYPSLPELICPSGFPIKTRSFGERETLRKYLIAHNIFPPVHWTLPLSVDKKKFANSWALSQTILTIPIDQRYSQKEMTRIVEVLSCYDARI